MEEEFRRIREFPGYSVSNLGRVRNDDSGRIMVLLQNQHGVVNVGLVKDLVQYKRSVPLLVAMAFVPRENVNFDTPIHLDGDLENNCASNLMWRPRWFAVKYHSQFRHRSNIGFRVPIEEIHSGERFNNSREAVVKYGLLEKELVLATLNNTYVYPTYQRFQVVLE